MNAEIVDRVMRGYARLTPTGRGGYRLVRAARRLRGRQEGLREFESPFGVHMSLDVYRYPDCTMAYGLYELETARTLRKLLRRGDTFIDVGANIGYFSLLAARCVGSAGAVHAFEPSPSNVARLQGNVARNGLASTIQVHAVALSDFTGPLDLYEYSSAETNHGQTTAYPLARLESVSIPVQAVQLDDALPDVMPRAIKLDIEGSELAALAGMAKTIERARPAVILEFNPVTLASADVSCEMFVQRISGLLAGYTCSILRWPVRSFELTAENLSRLGEINLLFVPGGVRR